MCISPILLYNLISATSRFPIYIRIFNYDALSVVTFIFCLCIFANLHSQRILWWHDFCIYVCVRLSLSFISIVSAYRQPLKLGWGFLWNSLSIVYTIVWHLYQLELDISCLKGTLEIWLYVKVAGIFQPADLCFKSFDSGKTVFFGWLLLVAENVKVGIFYCSRSVVWRVLWRWLNFRDKRDWHTGRGWGENMILTPY